MKGIVFTELLDMVDELFGEEVTEKIISDSELSSGGAYTAVSTYEHAELVRLVASLSRESGLSPEELYKAYGKHLFGVFSRDYGFLLTDMSETFSFLSNIEDYIHVEVRKLYPDAELPTFSHSLIDETHLELEYRSRRAMGDFAEGLMMGCAEYFGDNIVILRRDLSNGDGTCIQFTLEKVL